MMGEGGRSPDEGGAKGTAKARALRRRSTEAERKLWGLLRDRRLVGYKFRRQAPIGRYVADFACFEAKLVVELDGRQHLDSPRDAVRDAELRQRGLEVLRIWNGELVHEREAVLATIHARLAGRAGADDARR